MSNNSITTNHTRANYSINQAAEWLGVHFNTVRNLINDGQLGHFTVGKRVMISSNDLDKYRMANSKSPDSEINNNAKHS